MRAKRSEMNKISDDMLENVNGGVAGAGYSDAQLKSAGVSISSVGGSKTYSVTFSNGQSVKITQSVANDMYDCYQIAGGRKLTDQQIRDLIAQS